MRIETVKELEGFLLILAEGGERSQYVYWEARGAFGEADSGKVDVSHLAEGQAYMIKTGWEPSEIVCTTLRDSTPGMSQPFVCFVPQGICLLQFVAETGISSQIDLSVSASGDFNDTRSMGSLPKTSPGGTVELRIVMRQAWSKVFVKKMDEEKTRICLSRFKIKTATGETFESMSHLIKPEHFQLMKEGKDGLVFQPEAQRYAYFTMGFQRA